MIKRFALSMYATLICSTSAFAAEGSHGQGAVHHGGGHHEKIDGLPQLDPTFYASQTIWLILVFVFMYAFFALKSLPTISQTIENRAERIKNDLGSADRLKEEVESVHKSYEDSLSEARQKSAKLFVDLELEIKEQSEIQAHAFSELSAKKMAEAEKNIGAAHKKIMGEMNEVAADIAAAAAEKIIGVRADVKSAKEVVKSLNKAA